MMKQLKIGNVTLPNRYILGPMAGVTDLPFRVLCKEQGAGLLCMEMVSAKAIYYKNKNTQELMRILPEERPVSLQLFGSDPEIMSEMAKQIEEMGADSICIKDMAGLLVPNEATRLVTALKQATDIPIELHTHYTSGVGGMTYLKAVEAGVDIIDTAMSPFAMGTSQPATEVMAETFRGTEFDTGFDQKLLGEIADYFRPIREKYIANGLMSPKVLGVNIKTLMYQVPGGMLSNLVSQLEQQGASDKFYEVLEEVPKVRKDFGEPPLVTPSSQIVGTQAVLNVLTGERYKMITNESKALLHGEYGQTVKPMNKEVQKKAIGDEKPITCRPADLLEPELSKIEAEMSQWKEQDEDVLTYALFPQVATEFFKYRAAQENKIDPAKADVKNGAYPV